MFVRKNVRKKGLGSGSVVWHIDLSMYPCTTYWYQLHLFTLKLKRSVFWTKDINNLYLPMCANKFAYVHICAKLCRLYVSTNVYLASSLDLPNFLRFTNITWHMSNMEPKMNPLTQNCAGQVFPLYQGWRYEQVLNPQTSHYCYPAATSNSL